MRKWSHGLIVAALLSAAIVVALLFAAAGGPSIDIDVDLPKVKKSTPKTVKIK